MMSCRDVSKLLNFETSHDLQAINHIYYRSEFIYTRTACCRKMLGAINFTLGFMFVYIYLFILNMFFVWKHKTMEKKRDIIIWFHLVLDINSSEVHSVFTNRSIHPGPYRKVIQYFFLYWTCPKNRPSL